MRRPRPLTRLQVVAAVCVLPFVLLVPRLIWLQVLQSEALGRRTEMQNMRRLRIPPQRGDILDRNRARLAFSAPDTVAVDWDSGGEIRMRRLYALGESAAQLVGFVDARGRGSGGIERALEDELCGHPGWATELRDATGATYLIPGRPGKPQVSGYDVVLTLDAELQDIAHARLRRAVETENAKGGCLVAVDPHTGEILALAGYPSFDPEDVRGASRQVLNVAAVTTPYEPGSTFKLVTALSALESGLMKPNTIIHCENGRAVVSGRTVTDHEAFGALPLHSCFAHSSNVAFAKIGTLCGPGLYDTAIRMGFGTPTGLGLPGEASGYVPKPERWSKLTPASMAYGYEVMVTPLQLTMAYAAVANGGVLMRPWLVKSIEDEGGRVVYRNRPQAVHRVAEPAVARQLLSFMREVVTDGTGGSADLPWVEVAGKTGTAEKVINGSYSRSRHFASFVAAAPAESPRIVMLVLIDEPKSHFGGQAAAPVVREVLEAYRRLPGALLRPEYATLDVPGAPKRWSLSDFLVDTSVADPRDDAGVEPAGTLGGLPEVRGLSKRDALKLLHAWGVEITVDGSGRVYEQEPAPGSPLPEVVHLLCRPEVARFGGDAAEPEDGAKKFEPGVAPALAAASRRP